MARDFSAFSFFVFLLIYCHTNFDVFIPKMTNAHSSFLPSVHCYCRRFAAASSAAIAWRYSPYVQTETQYSDMPEEMKSECVELSMTACEKFANNYEVNQVNSPGCHIRFF